MQLQLPYYDYGLKVSQKDKMEIERLVETSLREFKGQKKELEELVLDCVSNISNSSSISAELSEQGPLKQLWGGITGKNKTLRDSLHKSTAKTQYAQQQILTKLIQQNASTMDFVAAIHKENHTITLEIKQQQLKTNERLKQICLNLIEQQGALVRLNEAQEQLSRELDNVVFICPKCRTFVKREAKICHRCGYLIRTTGNCLTTPQGSEQFRQGLDSLSNLIQEMCTMKNVISDHKLEWYQRKIRQIRRFVDRAELPEDIHGKVMAACTRFEHSLEKQHIEIAIAGTVKAGKSSLINALLDTEFATVDATPETSVLAKYRTTSGESYLKVRFFSESAWRNIWKDAQKSAIYVREYRDLRAGAEKGKWVGHKEYYKSGFDIPNLQAELNKYISSKSPVHFFVQDVEVGIHSDLFPHDVYLVDTPGLDDVVKTRSDVTRKYLSSAHAVLACIKEKSVHEGSETAFVSKVIDKMKISDLNSLFVVATQKDLDTPSDYQKNRRYFVEKSLGPMLKVRGGENYQADRHFFGVSAKMYTYALAYERGEKINKEALGDFYSMLFKIGYMDLSAINEHLEEIKKDSGIPLLKQNLKTQLFESTRKKLYVQMDGAFQDFLKQIHVIVEEGMKKSSDRLDTLAASESELIKSRAETSKIEELVTVLENYIKQVRENIGQGGGR